MIGNHGEKKLTLIFFMQQCLCPTKVHDPVLDKMAKKFSTISTVRIRISSVCSYYQQENDLVPIKVSAFMS